MENTTTKILNVVTIALMMFIFSGIVLLKLSIWAQSKEAEVAQVVADSGWENFRYYKTARNVFEKY